MLLCYYINFGICIFVYFSKIKYFCDVIFMSTNVFIVTLLPKLININLSYLLYILFILIYNQIHSITKLITFAV